MQASSAPSQLPLCKWDYLGVLQSLHLKSGYLRPQIGVFFVPRSYIYFPKEKSPELEDGHRQKMSPKLGDFFSDKVFLGCTCANVPINTFRPPMKHIVAGRPWNFYSWPHTPNPWGHVELVQKTWGLGSGNWVGLRSAKPDVVLTRFGNLIIYITLH